MIINLLQNYPTFLTESLDRYAFNQLSLPEISLQKRKPMLELKNVKK